MRGIEVIEREFSDGYGIIRPDMPITLFDCMLCINYPKINAMQFYVYFTMEDDARRIVALSLMRSKINRN